MEDQKIEKRILDLKKKITLYLYKSHQYLYAKWFKIKSKLMKFVDSSLFYLICLSIFVFILHKTLIHFNVNISEDHLYGFAFAVSGIVGASIAIIFSFSTFILQSTADLFSTQYLNKFINSTKEKVFFWLLVLLTILSSLVPTIKTKYIFEILVIVLLIAFYLIYSLYKELRKRINPETTLAKIKNDTIKQLEKANKELKKHSNFQNKIFEYKNEEKDLSLSVLYKANPNWNLVILENIKYLFEIGLRLLAKNEINAFNLTLGYINDIYMKHLELRNGHFIRMPASFWGTYSFEDEGVTTKILEYLESTSNRLIQEKRKENIYYLLSIYENILKNSLFVKYADKNIGAKGENPLLTLVLAYYIGLIGKLVNSKENDWIWESIKSISSVSNTILTNTDNYFVHGQINQTISKISLACLNEKQETFLKEILNIYFNQIKIGWDKYEHNGIFWKDLFKELKKSVLMLSFSSNLSLSTSELFIGFHSWQGLVGNHIFGLTDEKKKKEYIDKFILLIEKWSDFLLDFARDTGLENRLTGLPIIQSIDNNLRIIYVIRNNFNDIDLKNLYRTQFSTLSWYFEKTDKVDSSFLFNMEEVLKIILREIRDNLEENIFDVDSLIDLYIRLVQQHFEKVSVGYGYNHPRVIEKLIYIGLLLHKHKQKKKVNEVVKLIDELNKRYLELNKEYFELKSKTKNLMGPDEFQLCLEIHNLENDLFSYNSSVMMDIKSIIKQEITKKDWDSFISKISYCKGISYKTVSRF